MVFGSNIIYQRQACIAMISFLRQTKETDNIILLTDDATQYQVFKQGILIQVITSNTLEEWKGAYSFYWRAKIKGIAYVQELYPETNLLYIDTDTFLYGSLQNLEPSLEQQHCIMHLNEGKLHDITTKTCKTMYRQLKDFEYNGIKVTTDASMWNAGVIGIPSSKAKQLLGDVLAICDEMLRRKVKPKLMEQFSFSLCLENEGNLLSTDHLIAHYWSNKKEWDRAIADYMSNAWMENKTLLALIDQMNMAPFKTLPYYVKKSSFKEKLERKIATIWADKHHKYLSS